MNSLRIEHKRARPALGTLVQVSLSLPVDSDPEFPNAAVTETFALIERLEADFSKFRHDSLLAKVNRAELGVSIQVTREFAAVVRLSRELSRLSQGGFEAFTRTLELDELSLKRSENVQVDLSGIAKGFIVDQAAEFLTKRIPQASGNINAGGDLRFFNCRERTAEIQLAGQLRRPVTLNQDALATSAFTESDGNPLSTTHYPLEPRPGLTRGHTVSAIADQCAIADALTKVGWFAPAEAAQICAEKLGAHILIFDPNGETEQEFGPHEAYRAL